MSSFKKSTMGPIQLDPTLTWWTWTISLFTFVGLYKSSIRITQGKLYVKEVASVTRESTCVFPLLGTCSRLNNSNLNCKCLSILAFSHLLLLSRPSFGQQPILSLRTFLLLFPPILWTIDISSSKTSYLSSLFVAEKPSLSDLSLVICSGETRTSPTPEPLWFTTPLIYTFQNKGSCREIVPTGFPSMFCVAATSSNRGLAN